MSKRSLFWGNASGKLGETVMYRAGGEQRTRAYVAKIKNPKTKAQMEQRILMGNYNSIFKSLKTIIDEAFPLRKTNQSGWNAFVQANTGTPKSAIWKEAISVGGCAPYGVVIAKGDLPFSTVADVYESVQDPEYKQYNLPSLGVIRGEIVDTEQVGVDDLLSTGKAVYDYMTGNGNPLALPSEFKITVVLGYYGSIIAEAECYGLNVLQMVCNATNESGFKSLRYVDIEPSALKVVPAVASDTEEGANIKWTVSGLGIYPTGAIQGNGMIFGIIISWTENGKIRCTNTAMQLEDPEDKFHKQFLKDGVVWQQVLEQYGYKSNEVLGTK